MKKLSSSKARIGIIALVCTVVAVSSYLVRETVADVIVSGSESARPELPPVDPCQTINNGGVIIDFETIPNDAGELISTDEYTALEYPDEVNPETGTAEGIRITDQYAERYGVTFEYLFTPGDNPPSPFIGKEGGASNDYRAWRCDGCAGGELDKAKDDDTAAVLGKWFLATEKEGNVEFDPEYGAQRRFNGISISYARPVLAASGAIMDIDLNEKWVITAYNSAGQALESVTLKAECKNSERPDGRCTAPDNGTYHHMKYNGKFQFWKFQRGTKDIHQIKLLGSKSRTPRFGLAFDHFSPSAVCIPPELAGD